MGGVCCTPEDDFEILRQRRRVSIKNIEDRRKNYLSSSSSINTTSDTNSREFAEFIETSKYVPTEPPTPHILDILDDKDNAKRIDVKYFEDVIKVLSRKYPRGSVRVSLPPSLNIGVISEDDLGKNWSTHNMYDPAEDNGSKQYDDHDDNINDDEIDDNMGMGEEITFDEYSYESLSNLSEGQLMPDLKIITCKGD